MYKKTAHGLILIRDGMAIPTSPHQQVGVPRPGRVGAEPLSNFVLPARARPRWFRPPGNRESGINPRGFCSKKETREEKRKENSRTKKHTRFRKRGKQGISASAAPPGGREERASATARRRISSPAASACLRHRHHPKARYDLAACPRVGTPPRRAGGPCWGFGGVGRRGGASYALRRLDPVKAAAAAGFPDATATGGGREVRLDFSFFFLACPGSPVLSRLSERGK